MNAKYPWKTGPWVVCGTYRSGALYVCAPPGWMRCSDGTYEECDAKGPEHTPHIDNAAPFSLDNAQRIAALCPGSRIIACGADNVTGQDREAVVAIAEGLL